MDTHFSQLHPDLTIHQSEIFHTNTGIIKTAEGIVLVDPAFTQADIERIAAFIGQEPVLAGFSTHAHYDHLFWSSLFGDETPRYCSEGTLRQARQHRQEILDDAQAFENDIFNLNSLLIDRHFRHLSIIFTNLHILPAYSVEVVDIPGHMSGQAAFLFPEFGVLFAADTLSNIEPPSIEGSRQSLSDYLESFNKLEGLIKQVQWVIPGHGQVAEPLEALSRLQMDRRYLNALLSLSVQDFKRDSEALGQDFLEQIEETRAQTPDGWQMHLQNLNFVRNWLNAHNAM